MVKRHRAVLFVVAALGLNGCAVAAGRRESYPASVYVARTARPPVPVRSTRTDAPEWPGVVRTSEPASTPSIPVGALSKEEALRVIVEAGDGEEAIRRLDGKRLAFALDDEGLAWFADHGVPLEVMDYLTKRARVDYDDLRRGEPRTEPVPPSREVVVTEVIEPVVPPPPVTVVETWGWVDPWCQPSYRRWEPCGPGVVVVPRTCGPRVFTGPFHHHARSYPHHPQVPSGPGFVIQGQRSFTPPPQLHQSWRSGGGGTYVGPTYRAVVRGR